MSKRVTQTKRSKKRRSTRVSRLELVSRRADVDRRHLPQLLANAVDDDARQAVLARALQHCDEIALDGSLARASGILCGQTDTADVIDATVAVTAAGLARTGDVASATSDPKDLRRLCDALQSHARIITV